MRLLNIIENKKKLRDEELERKISYSINKGAATRSLLLVVGAFISAISFNLFYVPNNFVGGGLGGVAIIFNKLWNVNSSYVIIAFNFIFIILSIIFLGFRKSIMTIVGTSVYTAFVYFTSDIASVINFSFDETLLAVLAAGICGGFGESLVYKAGFNTGGTSIIALIIQKYAKVPLGKILRVLAYTIIISGGFIMGYTSIMYSLLISTISTQLVDKLLIGISYSKMFFIKTTKDKEIKDFIINVLECGVTELESKGAFLKKKRSMLMCVVPTEKYTLLKTAVKEIDDDVFIVVSDTYEVLGGTAKRFISLEELDEEE